MSRTYVLVLIGPPKCGKSHFIQMVKEYFKNQAHDFNHVETHYFDQYGYSPSTINVLLSHLNFQLAQPPANPTLKRLIIIDRNMSNFAERYEVFKLCKSKNAIYCQVFIDFDVMEVTSKNHATFSMMSAGTVLDFLRLCSPPKVLHYFEANSIHISKYFHVNFDEIRRLHGFLSICHLATIEEPAANMTD